MNLQVYEKLRKLFFRYLHQSFTCNRPMAPITTLESFNSRAGVVPGTPRGGLQIHRKIMVSNCFRCLREMCENYDVNHKWFFENRRNGKDGQIIIFVQHRFFLKSLCLLLGVYVTYVWNINEKGGGRQKRTRSFWKTCFWNRNLAKIWKFRTRHNFWIQYSDSWQNFAYISPVDPSLSLLLKRYTWTN